MLTASDLNASFAYITTNALSAISPLTGTLDADGQIIVLDADGDSSIQAATDDILTLKLQGASLFLWNGATASAVNGVTMTATATGNPPTIISSGSDTNIDLVLRGKGSGQVALGDASLKFPDTDGSIGYLLKTNGSGTLSFASPVSDLASATSTNTAGDPVDVYASGMAALGTFNEFWLLFEGVSLSGTDDLLIQLADTSGFITTGYVSRCMTINNATMSSESGTAGFLVSLDNGTGVLRGALHFYRELSSGSGDIWHVNGSLVNGIGTNGQLVIAGTSGPLPASALDGVRLNSSGTNNFDAGAISMRARL